MQAHHYLVKFTGDKRCQYSRSVKGFSKAKVKICNALYANRNRGCVVVTPEGEPGVAVAKSKV